MGTHKFISPDRVKKILDCYGGNANSWPKEEQSAALSLLKKSKELQSHQTDAESLDNAMGLDSNSTDLFERADATTVAKIINKLAAVNTSQVRPRWNISKFGLSIAASLSTIMFSAWLFFHFSNVSTTTIEQNMDYSQTDMDIWFLQDVTDSDIVDNEDPESLMALLELE